MGSESFGTSLSMVITIIQHGYFANSKPILLQIGLEGIFRGGYVFLCAVILLMAWVVYTSAGMACTFDPACLCTSYPPHLGQVSCHDAQIYLPQINTSKLFTLSLVNNDIDHIEPRLLHGTGNLNYPSSLERECSKRTRN